MCTRSHIFLTYLSTQLQQFFFLTFLIICFSLYWIIFSSMQTMFLSCLQNLTPFSSSIYCPILLFSFIIKRLKRVGVFCPPPHFHFPVRLLTPPFYQDCSCWIKWYVLHLIFSKFWHRWSLLLSWNSYKKRRCVLFLCTLFFLLPHQSLLFCHCWFLPISLTSTQWSASKVSQSAGHSSYHLNSHPWWSKYRICVNDFQMYLSTRFLNEEEKENQSNRKKYVLNFFSSSYMIFVPGLQLWPRKNLLYLSTTH